jgi:mRNA interferase RelE/StbE
MYSIEFTKKAESELYKSQRDVQERIIKSLERIKIRPYDYVEKLVGEPGFKFRIGDYRLILDINNYKLIILVLKDRKSVV